MTAALIIAAGRTAGRTEFQPEREVGALTAVQRIAMLFQQAGIRRIVVVSGEDGGQTEKLVSRMNLVFLRSAGEMLDSVKAGLKYLQGKCSRALITHVDVPLFSLKTVQALLEEEDCPVCVPAYQGKEGHPLLLSAEGFEAVLGDTGEGGLNAALKKSGLTRKVVEVPDEGVLTELPSDAAYQTLLAGHDLTTLRPALRVQLMKERPFYGPGTQQLLQLVDETGSLLDACRHMGISYSKGRKMIAGLEEEMGFAALESRQGGRDGGFSTLTAEARALMRRYSAFCEEAGQCVQRLFERHFPKDEE